MRHKPKLTQINVRCEPSLRAKLQAAADSDHRTLSEYIRLALDRLARRKPVKRERAA